MEKTYVKKLQDWVDYEKAHNGLIDMKFFPDDRLWDENAPPLSPEDLNKLIEKKAKVVYEIVTGIIPSVEVDASTI